MVVILLAARREIHCLTIERQLLDKKSIWSHGIE